MILGIDVGGTNIKFGVTDDELNIVNRLTLPTNAHLGIDSVINTVISGAKRLMDETPYERIGLGTPGKIDYERGLLVSSANIPYDNTPIVKILGETLGVPVFIGNDANCATIAEARAGHGRIYKSFVMLTIGTGIGGGIVINGEPYLGMTKSAGELGHVSVNLDGELCRCGIRGCFEGYASVSALVKTAEYAAKQNEDSLLAKRITECGLNGKAVFDASELGCSVADEVIDKFINNLALGIINYQRIFDPEAIVLGGAITASADRLLKPLIKAANIPCPILISALGTDTGIIGAAALTKEK